MGTPAPIILPGLACPTCFGPGKKFGDIVTPKAITVVVSGITKSPTWVAGDGEAFEGSMTLTDYQSFMCNWHAEFGDYDGTWSLATTFSNLSIYSTTHRWCWFSTIDEPCVYEFPDNDALAFENGTVELLVPGVNI